MVLQSVTLCGMPISRRRLLATVPLAATAGVAGAVTLGSGASAEPSLARTPVATKGWCSGVTDPDPLAFGTWRGSPVGIAGMFGDTSLAAQLEQWQYTHSPTFTADVDLAVGGPIGVTWARAAAGSEVAHWKQIAGVLRETWHSRTVYLRFAHEFNGKWMPWSVAPAQVPAFKAAFRLFATTMRRELKGHDVKIVFAPNYGTWFYTPDSAWPGTDVVDVVGVSMYEWTLYDTAPKWKQFLASSIGPNVWSAYAKRHGRPLAFSEWGARSPYFVRAMHAWMTVMGGRGPGQLLYDVYLNDNELVLAGSVANQYRALKWGHA
jgi:hypothetical protein